MIPPTSKTKSLKEPDSYDTSGQDVSIDKPKVKQLVIVASDTCSASKAMTSIADEKGIKYVTRHRGFKDFNRTPTLIILNDENVVDYQIE